MNWEAAGVIFAVITGVGGIVYSAIKTTVLQKNHLEYVQTSLAALVEKFENIQAYSIKNSERIVAIDKNLQEYKESSQSRFDRIEQRCDERHTA